MPAAKTSTNKAISPRKMPKQGRSTQLVEDILEAAVRVLTREGARRFTTVRVAEEAGVSVGSLYQYFPNKEALLFRLQTDEWAETWQLLESIFIDQRLTPLARLRKAVVVFFHTEREEAAFRVALDDAGVLLRDAPESKKHLTHAKRRVATFFEELLPHTPAKERAFAADFVMTSMGAVAETITAEGRSRAEVEAWAQASATMFANYVTGLAAVERPATPGRAPLSTPPALPRGSRHSRR